ncbi:hypothetical protein FNF29_06752 [Cafeteria roenbergensis]|uniref:Rab-GAP TBC domain-containing protein n=1 Tax=Cafeteria roenbergensis TaxID=33653 RepID=A0A5A8DV17_CAFRO|nr:hypothetical protein FNF29_06752 [Cafeteria roenbergensis]KAA0169293.1 hypothetical protein FNF28_02247 [Cafeteria roenbergensis]|eukprot:KAA0148365.1 hypothetical protein FNF29_06752 [Cafeteria roenbergensis]
MAGAGLVGEPAPVDDPGKQAHVVARVAAACRRLREAPADEACSAKLRRLVLCEGLPRWSPACAPSLGLRAEVWSLLLGAPRPAESEAEFARLAELGPCPGAELIPTDVPRTLRTARSFAKLVPDDSLRRVLQASAHDHRELAEALAQLGPGAADGRVGTGANLTVYAQGLNRVAGILLLVMPEAAAFGCLRALRRRLLPATWSRPRLEGVVEACECVRMAVSALDPSLHDALDASMSAGESWPRFWAWSRLCALHAIPTSDADLAEIVALWDGFFALGGHAPALLCVADLLPLSATIIHAAAPLLRQPLPEQAPPPAPAAIPRTSSTGAATVGAPSIPNLAGGPAMVARGGSAALTWAPPRASPESRARAEVHRALMMPSTGGLNAREQLDALTAVATALPDKEMAELLDVCAGTDRVWADVEAAEALIRRRVAACDALRADPGTAAGGYAADVEGPDPTSGSGAPAMLERRRERAVPAAPPASSP